MQTVSTSTVYKRCKQKVSSTIGLLIYTLVCLLLKEIDDVDEDALLGIGADDEFQLESFSQKPNASTEEHGLFSTTNDTIEDDEMIQLGVDDGDDLDE